MNYFSNFLKPIGRKQCYSSVCVMDCTRKTFSIYMQSTNIIHLFPPQTPGSGSWDIFNVLFHSDVYPTLIFEHDQVKVTRQVRICFGMPKQFVYNTSKNNKRAYDATRNYFINKWRKREYSLIFPSYKTRKVCKRVQRVCGNNSNYKVYFKFAF